MIDLHFYLFLFKVGYDAKWHSVHDFILQIIYCDQLKYITEKEMYISILAKYVFLEKCENCLIDYFLFERSA